MTSRRTRILPAFIGLLVVVSVAFGPCGDDDPEPTPTAAVTTSTPSPLPHTPTPTPSPTATPTAIPTPSPTATPSASPAPTASSTATVSTDAATLAAQGALPQVADLPGDDWEVSNNGMFSSDPLRALRLEQPACATLRDSAEAIQQLRAEQTVARAEREISRGGGLFDPIGTTVTTNIEVLETDSAPLGIVAASRELTEDPGFASCFTQSIDSPLLQGTNVNTRTTTTSSPAPQDGFAAGIALDVSAIGVSLTVHVETYVWGYRNAVVQVTVISTSEIDSALTSGVTSAIQRRLEALILGP